MRAKYYCEKCGKSYGSEDEALQCERNCTEKEEAYKRKEAEKERRTIELVSMAKKFEEDYGYLPYEVSFPRFHNVWRGIL